MKSRSFPWLLTGLCLLINGAAARAHGIESSLERLAPLTDASAFAMPRRQEADLQLESHFSTGLPASDAVVRLVPAGGGTPIELGRTNAEGRLTFTLPRGALPDWEVQVDAGPGHRDYLELPTASGNPHATTHMQLTQLTPLAPGVVGLGLLSSLGAVPLLRRR